MAQINEFLNETGGLQSMANELGISEGQAAAGAAALLPAILGGFKKQAQSSPDGLSGLGGLLNQLGGASLLDDVRASHPTNVARGNDVLGQIFGSKDVSRTVAQNASAKTGIDTTMLKRMLPMLAMLAAGYMAKQRATGEATADASAAGATPRRGGGGLGSLIDMDGDGNPLDDILRMGGKFFR
jgi:hypothetical protein